MGESVLDWTLEEAAQCWWELHWLWHSEGVKVNLTSKRAELYSEAVSESQSETERVETVARPPWSNLQQSGWAELAQWV